jgi:hypothetical protein
MDGSVTAELLAAAPWSEHWCGSWKSDGPEWKTWANGVILGSFPRNTPSSSGCANPRPHGRPGACRLDSRPSCSAVRSTQPVLPYGLPRCTLRRGAANSASVCGVWTRSSQPAGRGTGPGASHLCKKATIPNHVQIGVSSIGGSKVIQHWDIAEEKNTAKQALKAGKVDVLTLSPIFFPDAGIENFTQLALEHNKDIRIVVQPIWLRWDIYEPTTKRPEKVDHNAITGEELRMRHAVYFKEMDEFIRALNKKQGRTVLFVVPAGQAVIALREKIIAGQAPGLKTQEALFTDALGHGTPPLQALVAYCNYAVIYRRSPVGLPVPSVLKQAKLGDQEEKLNWLLQELAWEAVTQHPLSGIRLEAQP